MAGPRYLVVANPVARLRPDVLLQLLQRSAAADADFDVVATVAGRFTQGELRERAIGAKAVIAVGGDGTVADAATAIEGAGVPLAVIPAGSTNVLARAFRIPKDPRRAAEIAFARPATRCIDVALCNGRSFLHMGGAGFDSRMFELTSVSLKRRLGWGAYLQGASRSIRLPAARMSVQVDGQLVEARSPLVLVANGPSIISPRLKIHPGIEYDDGVLDVIILTATRARQMVRAAGRLLARSLDRSPFALHLRGQSIRIDADPPIAVELDGDVIGPTPADFSIRHRALELIVPG